MSLPKSFTTVTPLSKTLALSMLVVLPILGFLLGMKYQSSILPQADCNYSGFCEPTRIHMVSGSLNQSMWNHLFWFLPIILIGVALKGYALWHAGKNRQSGWFLALFIINSLGILPLIYLTVVKPKNKTK